MIGGIESANHRGLDLLLEYAFSSNLPEEAKDGVSCRGYHSEGTKSLGLDARYCNKIAGWVDEKYHEFEEAEKISRMKV